MWTQRDQLQAFQFLRRRIVSAVQFGDANHPVAPGRRVLLATVSGLGAMLLVAGGLLVFAVLRPGSTADWREPGQILIEKESGAGFVLGADGLVHPVLNYASARLLIGGDRTTSIPAKSLADAPRGRPLGIPDGPASIPAPRKLIAGPWAVCATPDVTTLVVGGLVPGDQLTREQGVIVADPDGVRHLLTDGRRLRLRGNAVVALGYDAVLPTPVSKAWLDAVPAGTELALLTVPDSGDEGPRFAGTRTRVGQVLQVDGVGGEVRYYLAARAALVPIGQVEAALIVGDPGNRAARPVRVSAADLTAAGLVTRGAAEQKYPARLPAIVRKSRTALCAGVSGDGPARLWTADAPPLPSGARALPVAGSNPARQIFVKPGTGLLITADDGPVHLVTDQGIRYPLRDRAAEALGYRDAPITTVPAGLLKLLPTGPELSTEAASQEEK